jgi:hypothetical protein
LSEKKVLLWLLFDIVITSLICLTPFVDNFTDLRGMIYGFFCGLSMMECLSTNFFGIVMTFWTHLHNVLIQFFGLILKVILIMITIWVLVDFNAGRIPCPSCHYISCMLFLPWAGEDNK